MALDQSALLDVLEALKTAEVDDRIRQAAETIYQALIEADLTSVIGAYPYQRAETRTGQRITGRSRARSHLNYRGALNLDAHRGQRKGGRAVHYRPIDAAVLAAVARAVDCSAGLGVDDAAQMGTDGGERVEGTGLRLRDHDLLVGEDLAAANRDVSRAGQDGGRVGARR